MAYSGFWIVSDMDSCPVSGTTVCFPQLPYVLLSNGETWGTRARGDSLQTLQTGRNVLPTPPTPSTRLTANPR